MNDNFLKMQENNSDSDQVDLQLKSQINQKNGIDLVKEELDLKQRKLPRTLIVLMNYFPREIIDPFLETNSSIDVFKHNIKQLGLFLLFGEQYKTNNSKNSIKI